MPCDRLVLNACLVILVVATLWIVLNKMQSNASKPDLPSLALRDGFEITVLHSGGRDFCLAVVCIGDAYRQDVVQYTQSKLDYARRHDYTLVMLDKVCREVLMRSESRHPSWSKLPFVNWLLGHFHTVCMVDADVYVSNMQIPIHRLVDDRADVAIGSTTYRDGPPVLQSSTVVFRSRARAAIRRAANKTMLEGKRPHFPGLDYEDWGEQTFLQHELEENQEHLHVQRTPLTCLQKDHDCQGRFPFWHVAGSNLQGGLDKYITDFRRTFAHGFTF